ncbi:MAG: hypothetical protein E7J02_13125 [Staphylococcus warneri]|nr:hypothetical protein [Staphylococcus warneri]
MSNYTKKDIDTLDKIEWEGGAYEALDYGIKADDFDNAELRKVWQEMEAHNKEIEKLSRIIDQAIEEVAGD